jgi:hypothetical protein
MYKISKNYSEKWNRDICKNKPKEIDNTLDKEFLVQDETKKEYYKSKSDYCIFCNEVYHKSCNHTFLNIVAVTSISNNKKYESFSDEFIHDLIFYYKNKDIVKLNKDKLIELKKEIEFIIEQVNECLAYKKVHHEFCILNIKDKNNKRGDPEHSARLNILEKLIDICKKLSNKILVEYTKIIKKRSRLTPKLNKKKTRKHYIKTSRYKSKYVKRSKHKKRSNRRSLRTK